MKKKSSKYPRLMLAARWIMAKLAVENRTVFFDDVRRRLNVPADFPPQAWGWIAADLHRLGFVRPIGAKQSTFASRHGGLQIHWRLADRRAALRFIAMHDASEFRDLWADQEPTLFDDLPPQHTKVRCKYNYQCASRR